MKSLAESQHNTIQHRCIENKMREKANGGGGGGGERTGWVNVPCKKQEQATETWNQTNYNPHHHIMQGMQHGHWRDD
jgi:hypothetical protein